MLNFDNCTIFPPTLIAPYFWLEITNFNTTKRNLSFYKNSVQFGLIGDGGGEGVFFFGLVGGKVNLSSLSLYVLASSDYNPHRSTVRCYRILTKFLSEDWIGVVKKNPTFCSKLAQTMERCVRVGDIKKFLVAPPHVLQWKILVKNPVFLVLG